MTPRRTRSVVALAMVLALGVVPTLSGAQQDSVPTREANTWDWRHHEPAPSVVKGDEQAAGIAPSESQQKKSTDTVENLYRQLMKDEGKR